MFNWATNNTNNNKNLPQYDKLFQSVGVAVILLTYFYYLFYNANYDYIESTIKKITKVGVGYCVLHYLYYFFDIHKRYGVWKCTEPPSHLKFAMRTVWIVLLFVVGANSIQKLFGLTNSNYSHDMKVVTWEFSDKYKIIRSETLGSDVAYGIILFYFMDFCRYWAHRLGHWSFFYKTFPFSHAHHHNQIFVNPMSTIMSPIFHVASYGTFVPPTIVAAMGMHRVAFIGLFLCAIPNWTQHLGFDPFPWLTRANHYYFLGALPWIPLYHCYHHIPFIKTGNFGNTTALFDYLFDTLQPECVYHIENNCMLPSLEKIFADPVKLNRILDSSYKAGNNKKNQMDLNDGYNSSMFKSYFL